MPAEGGVSNYAFPIPFPGRKDHCSIQVFVVMMMMMVMVMMMMMVMPIAQVSASTIVMTGGLDTEDMVTEVAPWMLLLMMMMMMIMMMVMMMMMMRMIIASLATR